MPKSIDSLSVGSVGAGGRSPGTGSDMGMRRPPSRSSAADKKKAAFGKSIKKAKGALGLSAAAGVVSIATKASEKPYLDAPERKGAALKKKFYEISNDWENSNGNSPAQQELEDKLKKVKENLRNK
jgi:hypothetical protein